jgi:hypothetical protein
LKVGDYGLYKYSGYDDYDNKDINVPSHWLGGTSTWKRFVVRCHWLWILDKIIETTALVSNNEGPDRGPHFNVNIRICVGGASREDTISDVWITLLVGQMRGKGL